MIHACTVLWKRPIVTQTLGKRGVVQSSSRCRRRSREGRREGRCFSASTSGSGEKDSLQPTDSRQYHYWSPPGVATRQVTEHDASLDSTASAEPAAPRRKHHQPEPAARPKAASKSPQAIAMEEFAALERKLAQPRAPPRKSPEQVAMEEFAALERKLRPAADAGATESTPATRRGSGASVSSPKARPQEPDAQECCGNGCATCVWIGYWEELQAWEEAEREREREGLPP